MRRNLFGGLFDRRRHVDVHSVWRRVQARRHRRPVEACRQRVIADVFSCEPALIVEHVVAVSKVELVADAAQRFRWSKEQESARRQRHREPVDELPHSLRREVDHDVAAEDHIECVRSPEAPVVIEQVPDLEANVRRQPAVQGKGTPVLSKVLAPLGLGEAPERPGGVDRRAGLVQQVRVDIDADNPDVPPLDTGNPVDRRAQRVRLFTRRATRRQQTQRSSAPPGFDSIRERDVDQCPELLGVPEEIGFGNRQLHGDLEQLSLRERLVLEPLEVRRHAAAARAPQGAAQRLIDLADGVRVYMEAESRDHDVGKPLELGVRCVHHRLSHPLNSGHTSAGTTREVRSTAKSSLSSAPSEAIASDATDERSGGTAANPLMSTLRKPITRSTRRAALC